MKASGKVKVRNPKGLHARPASAIVRMLQGSSCDVRFTYRKETINARSIMSLLTLAATRNSTILIEVEGEDAKKTLDSLVEAFEEKFGESQ